MNVDRRAYKLWSVIGVLWQSCGTDRICSNWVARGTILKREMRRISESNDIIRRFWDMCIYAGENISYNIQMLGDKRSLKLSFLKALSWNWLWVSGCNCHTNNTWIMKNKNCDAPILFIKFRPNRGWNEYLGLNETAANLLVCLEHG